MNRGAKTRGIIIARSLPESLRPKSPRSTTSSCYNSPRGNTGIQMSCNINVSSSHNAMFDNDRIWPLLKAKQFSLIAITLFFLCNTLPSAAYFLDDTCT